MATAEEIQQQQHAANADLPVWIAHGSQDAVVPLSLGEQALKVLKAMALNPQWQSYPIGHEVSLDEMAALGEWINQRFAESNK